MKYLLLFFLSSSLFSQDKLSIVYVNHETGSDSNVKCSDEKPLKTFSRAMRLIKESGTLYIQQTSTPYKESLHVSVGGSEAEPLKIIADKAVIDLSTDISSGPWIKEGDSYILDKQVKRQFTDSQRAALYVNSIPVHPFSKHLKEKHHMTCLEEGRIKVRFPDGINPLENKHKILLNAPPYSNAVSFGKNASHVIIDGLTVKFSGNDGFNLHGAAKNIIIKNCVTAFNGDEGISAHEEIEVKVFNSIIAFNGSSAGGIADVDRSVSYYTDCLLVNNYAHAFYFTGKEHGVKNCVVWGNRSKLYVDKKTEIKERNIIEFSDKNEALNKLNSLPETLQKIVKAYSLSKL